MNARPAGNNTIVGDCPFEQQGFAAAYALDALDGDERRAFEAHLAATACPVCAAEIAATRALTAQLPLALAETEAAMPSPALRARILDVIAAEEAASVPPLRPAEPEVDGSHASHPALAPLPAPAVARWRAPQAYAAAAVLLLSIGLGLLGWNLDLQRQVREARVERDQARAALATWTLSSTTGQPASGQVLYLREHQQAILIVNNLPPLPPDQVYQVWLIQNGQPQGAGILSTPTGETAMPADMSRYQQIAITIEPGPNGSPAPTSQPILAGRLGH